MFDSSLIWYLRGPTKGLLWQPMKKGTCSINVKQWFFCRDFGPKSWYFEWPPDYLNLKTSLLSLHQIETATGHVVSEQTKRKHMTPIWKGMNITFWRPHPTSPQHHARGNSAFDTWHWMNRFQQRNDIGKKWLVFPNNCTFILIRMYVSLHMLV